MKKAKKFLKIILFSLALFLSAFGGVKASSLWDRQQKELGTMAHVFGEDKANPTDVRHRVVKLINWVLTLLGIVVVILIIFAGFKWMTAAGNEDAVKKAKTILTNAVIGLIIIVLAWSVTLFILRRLNKNYLESDMVSTPYTWR